MRRQLWVVTHTHTHTHTHTYTHMHPYTHDNYYIWKHWSANPRRNLHTAIYSINILSKYSSLISHRPSMFEGRHIDYQSSKVDTSITDLRRSTHQSSVFEGQHIHLRRSTHRSSKVDTSFSEGRHIVTSIFEGRHTIFEGRHIDLWKSTHQSSIFENRRIVLRRSKAETSHLQFVVEYCPQLRS